MKKVQIEQIAGIIPALESMYMSKRTLNDDIRQKIHDVVLRATDKYGFYNPVDDEAATTYNDMMLKLIKWGVKHDHASLLDFIVIYPLMVGLHRGAQDDWDSHAGRMLSIIRSSTRLATFESGEISDWYKDKILYADQVTNAPDEVVVDGTTYQRTHFGFIRSDLVGDRDVQRGLVPLAIPSNNVSGISYRNLRYVYYRRNRHTHAAPELQEYVELLREELLEKQPILGEYLDKVWSEDEGRYIPVYNAVYTSKQ